VPFYLGIAFAAAGLALSALFVRDTTAHVRQETAQQPPTRGTRERGSVRGPVLLSTCQAGLINNLNDGLAWGLFPLFFAAAGLGSFSVRGKR